MSRVVLRGGWVVHPDQPEPVRADVAIVGDRISAVGEVDAQPGDRTIDAGDRLILPGFADLHCHVDATIFEDEVAWAFLRQGVTTAVAGQDGVSFAPGDGRYASDYFAALNGAHPSYTGGGVEAFLAHYDGQIPITMAYLVPAGTVRHEVMGYRSDPANPDEIRQMQALVADGIAAGAVGLSSGLDYVPNAHQDTDELAALCRPVADAGALYVTHMRGGYEENSAVGTREITRIAQDTGVRAHISHYHAQPDLLIGLLEEMAAAGVDVTFDAYPYRRGFTLLSMVVLPASLLSNDKRVVAAQLGQADVRQWLISTWLPQLEATSVLGDTWPHASTIAHVSDQRYTWAQGLTILEAASRAGATPAEFTLDLLHACDMDVSVVVRVRTPRSYSDLVPVFTDPRFCGGSDGITIGANPHPRAFGSFAKYLRLFVREFGAWTWSDAVRHLSTLPAHRLGLAGRGRIAPNHVADLMLVDPATAGDTASYADPRRPASGIDDVLVAGVQVLRDGQLTGARPGGGLRRSRPPR